MKKLFPFFLSLLALSACTSEFDKMLNDSVRARRAEEGRVFYATIEDTGYANPQTKVYADEQMRVLWNADDTISIFKKTTFNRPYLFTGQEGSNAGGFNELPIDDEFITENPLSYNYAIYPYREETLMSYEGVLAVDMPAVQVYKEKSFGIGANTMVSVTEDNILQFKNVGGYLSFKFYGDGVSVKSITLKGNNHEKLAGKAAIIMSASGTPVVAMQGTATEEITLTCTEPVELGVESEHYTDFWFVLPPTEFTKGFTVIVTDKRGGVFTTATSNDVSVARNTLSRMAPMEVVPEYQYVPFADANFKAYCVANFDRNSDGEISMSEASNIRNINVSTADIESLQGIEYMPNLRSLYCRGQSNNNRGKLTNLDIRRNTALLSLECYFNQLTSLDVSHNTALTNLRCDYNQLTSLDVGNNTSLTRLICGGNQLAGLNVSQNTALQSLSCRTNQLTSLDVSSNTSLTSLNCGGNQLTGLNVSQNTSLLSLSCDSNQLMSLDVSKNTSLLFFECYSNQLTSLEVSSNTVLQYLYCQGNQLLSLDVSQNAALMELACNNNQLLSLDVSQNQALAILSCSNNQLTSLDVSKNTALVYLVCEQNQLASLDLSQNMLLQSLYCADNQLTILDISNNSALSDLFCSTNAPNIVISIRSGQIFRNFGYDKTASIVETGDPIPSGNITFPDPTFKANCVNQFDVNKDGEISYAEALLITRVDGSNQNIASLAGIEYFVNLRYLNCNQNQLTSLDVSKNTALIEMACYNNQLTSLDVSKNTALRYLECGENKLESLNVSNCTALQYLYCQGNQLTSLDVSNNSLLVEFWCYGNQLMTLDISNNLILEQLLCYNNQLAILDVSSNASLTDLSCSGNPNLSEVWLKTNQTIPYFDFDPDIADIKYKD